MRPRGHAAGRRRGHQAGADGASGQAAILERMFGLDPPARGGTTDGTATGNEEGVEEELRLF